MTLGTTKLQEGWTPWQGSAPAPIDYINGPLFLRDGSIRSPDCRIQEHQWTWDVPLNPSKKGEIPDDIIGYMPGFIKPWNFGEHAPKDWDGGLVLWNDNTIWSEGLQPDSIAWNIPFAGATTSSIMAYTSNEVEYYDPTLKLEVGRSYANRKGETANIVAALTETDSRRTAFGFAFTDDIGRVYKEDGKNNSVDLESEFDLVFDLTAAEQMFERDSEGYVPGSILEAALDTKFNGRRYQVVLDTMENFPVLAGRCTKGHAEYIVKALDKYDAPSKKEVKVPLVLEIGKSYLTESDMVVKLTESLSENDQLYSLGYRFIASNHMYYKPDGTTTSRGILNETLVKEVHNLLDEGLTRSHDNTLAELGYIAAMGQNIRAIKLYRTMYGVSLFQAKNAVTEAAEIASKQYLLDPVRYAARIAELEAALRTTRELVSDCCESGFTDSLPVNNLFKNQAAICKVVPLRPQDRVTPPIAE